MSESRTQDKAIFKSENVGSDCFLVINNEFKGITKITKIEDGKVYTNFGVFIDLNGELLKSNYPSSHFNSIVLIKKNNTEYEIDRNELSKEIIEKIKNNSLDIFELEAIEKSIDELIEASKERKCCHKSENIPENDKNIFIKCKICGAMFCKNCGASNTSFSFYTTTENRLFCKNCGAGSID